MRYRIEYRYFGLCSIAGEARKCSVELKTDAQARRHFKKLKDANSHKENDVLNRRRNGRVYIRIVNPKTGKVLAGTPWPEYREDVRASM